MSLPGAACERPPLMGAGLTALRPEHLCKRHQPFLTGGKCGRASKMTTASSVGAGSRLETLVHTSEGHVLLARFQAPRSSPPHAPNPPLSDRNTGLLPAPQLLGAPPPAPLQVGPEPAASFPKGPWRGAPRRLGPGLCAGRAAARGAGPPGLSLGPRAVPLRPPPNLPTPSGPKPLFSTRCFFLGTLVTREGEEKRGSPHGPPPGLSI